MPIGLLGYIEGKREKTKTQTTCVRDTVLHSKRLPRGVHPNYLAECIPTFFSKAKKPNNES